MLSMLNVNGARGTSLALPIGEIVEGIMISSIDGLQPVKASISSSTFATIPGERFQGSRREKRNIVVSFRLEPFFGGSTVYEIRKRLYEFFMPDFWVDLEFVMQDGLKVKIRGQVEEFSTDLFVQEPSATVSIICYEPDFIEDQIITGTITSTGARGDSQEYLYSGSVATGLEMFMQLNSSQSQIELIHYDQQENTTSMVLDMPFLAGDRLYINTNIGDKSIIVTRGSAARSYLYAMTPGSGWIQLQPGTNRFVINVGLFTTESMNISYKNRYGGL